MNGVDRKLDTRFLVTYIYLRIILAAVNPIDGLWRDDMADIKPEYVYCSIKDMAVRYPDCHESFMMSMDRFIDILEWIRPKQIIVVLKYDKRLGLASGR